MARVLSRMPRIAALAGTAVLLIAATAAGQWMARVPGGAFIFGVDSGEADERPARTVTLSAFAIDSTEVTVARYDSCVRAGACSPAHMSDGKCMIWTGGRFSSVMVPAGFRSANHPVICVTWYQARDYCRFTGRRLPTEPEWEYAALAGRSGASYAWGSALPDASRCAQPSERGPRPAGSCGANTWGLYDMTGNVWEWTADRYRRDQYAAAGPVDPAGPDAGLYRVIRGGGWYSDARQLRIKNRHWFEPSFAEASIGFRCAQ